MSLETRVVSTLLLGVALSCCPTAAFAQPAPPLSLCESLLRTATDWGCCVVPNADDCALKMRHCTTVPVDVVLATVLDARHAVPPITVKRALRIARSASCKSDKLAASIREILQADDSPSEWVCEAASVASCWGDLQWLPILLKRWNDTTDPVLKSELGGSFWGFGEFGVPYLRETTKADTDRNRKFSRLCRLVVLNDSWAYEELQKPEYRKSELLRFKIRSIFWQRERRLQWLKAAKSGKAPPERSDDYREWMPPRDWRAPWER